MRVYVCVLRVKEVARLCSLTSLTEATGAWVCVRATCEGGGTAASSARGDFLRPAGPTQNLHPRQVALTMAIALTVDCRVDCGQILSLRRIQALFELRLCLTQGFEFCQGLSAELGRR